jgi:hypothetical protein
MAPRSLLAFALAAFTLAAGCATTNDEPLDMAVSRYNESLRWKRFADAAAYLVPEARRAFLARYLASEEKLHIDSLEVRAIAEITGTVPTYDVTVVAQTYVLPSTVVTRVIMTQRWELAENGWRMLGSDRELAPLVARR